MREDTQGLGEGVAAPGPQILGTPVSLRVFTGLPSLRPSLWSGWGRRRLLLVGYSICGSACLTLTLVLLFQVWPRFSQEIGGRGVGRDPEPAAGWEVPATEPAPMGQGGSQPRLTPHLLPPSTLEWLVPLGAHLHTHVHGNGYV